MEELRYKQIGELINKLNCKSVGDFASGDEQIKNFLKKIFLINHTIIPSITSKNILY
ncbi:MAG: hypothetical protein BWY36_00520 [Candidatus Diapherotrites archaeon ADurb.Bin253]|nr:MAG: hypothetical protein BWY36_00520 [Candidatus Diapherotrites archaeon ADurb.Bin253]